MIHFALSPVFFRELRSASRQKWTWRRRLICAGVALFGAVAIHSARFGGLAAMNAVHGQTMFLFLVWSIYCGALAAGAIFTADLLSGERRDGTMDLLLLTKLNPAELVLAKLLSASVETFSVLLGLMPFMAFPMILGGVSVESLGASVLVLMNTLFLSLVAGLAASASVRNGRTALLLTGLLSLSMAVGPLLLAGSGIAPASWAGFSTAGLLVMAAAGPTFVSGDPFLHGLLVQHLAGWFGVVVAVLLVRAASQGRTFLNRIWDGFEARRQKTEKELRRGRRNPRLLEANPVAWLITREQLPTALVWGTIALLALVVFPLSVFASDWWLNAETVTVACFVLHGSVKLWIALEATRRLAEDKRTGALQLVLATALTPKEVLRGLERGIVRRFRMPMGAVLAIDFLMVALAMARGGGSGEIVVVVVQSMLIFFFDCFALVWMGLWDGAAAPNATRALIRTTLKILVLPWLASFMLFALISASAGGGVQTFYLMAACWFFVSYVCNAGYYAVSLNQLTRHIHELAAGVDPSDAKRPALGWLEEYQPPRDRLTPPPLPRDPVTR